MKDNQNLRQETQMELSNFFFQLNLVQHWLEMIPHNSVLSFNTKSQTKAHESSENK